MKAEQFIQLAGTLVVNPGFGDAAARNRTAVSRAYYGVFHRAVELLLDFGVTVPENPTGHQVAYLSLLNSAVPRAVEAAKLLHDLRRERIHADYRLDHTTVEAPENATRCVEAAHNFYLCASDCLQEPIRTQLATALGQ
jgi:uncharacterized protein (UPF0332 family)